MAENINEPKNDVPYIVYEGAQVRNERNIKRLVIALIIAVSMLFVTNAIWIYEEFKNVDNITVEGTNYVANVGNSGDVYNKEKPTEKEMTPAE